MILITGAAGYIGSKLIDLLAKKEIPMRAIDNFRVYPPPPINGVTIQPLDLTQADDVKKMVKGIDTIIHLGAISDISQCETHAKDAILINLLSLKYLVREAVRAGVKKIIFPSTFAVYDPQQKEITEQTLLNPSNFYGQLKKWAEELLLKEQVHLDVVIFRQSNVYGKGWVSKKTVVESFCKSFLENQPITINGSGQQTRNFIHVDDVVWAYYQGLSPSIRGIYNLGGKDTLSIWELAHLVNRVGEQSFNRSVPIIRKQKQAISEPKTHLITWNTEKTDRLFKGRTMKSLQKGIQEYFEDPD
ncbi:NAD-dependent epimerase/dehydratase family protein [Kroppenstedtia sanguinis]|uniref:NAD-dependent epimerase/dehydratase family protein n=1 Tax=Kroppenstedtia sanguinis TaxID=1380684 RepID=A0ABW4CD97_9BACL